jgi:hypothetical protein
LAPGFDLELLPVPTSSACLPWSNDMHKSHVQVVHVDPVLCTCLHSPARASFAIVRGCAAPSQKSRDPLFIGIFAGRSGARPLEVSERRNTYK